MRLAPSQIMDSEDDDIAMPDIPGTSSSQHILSSMRGELRTAPNPRPSSHPNAPTEYIILNGFRGPSQSSVALSDDEPAVTSAKLLKRPSRETSVLARDTNHLSLIQTPPPAGEQLDAYLSELELEEHDSPSPFLSELPTGYCYDVRMRYHCELEPPKDRRDYHPEDPRRIFSIYRELCMAGLIDDSLLCQNTGAAPLVPTPLKQIDVREVEESEVELVHDKKHWEFMRATTREFFVDCGRIVAF